MGSERAVANLRHLYGQMVNGHVRDTAEAARGLLGPAIAELERALAAPAPVVAPAPERTFDAFCEQYGITDAEREEVVHHLAALRQRRTVERLAKPRLDRLSNPLDFIGAAAPLPVEGNRKLSANSEPLPVETPRHLIHDFAEGPDGVWRCACGATSAGPLTGVLASPPLPVETDATPLEDEEADRLVAPLFASEEARKPIQRRAPYRDPGQVTDEGDDANRWGAPAPLDDGGAKTAPWCHGCRQWVKTGQPWGVWCPACDTAARIEMLPRALDDGETGGADRECWCSDASTPHKTSRCDAIRLARRGPSGTPGGGT